MANLIITIISIALVAVAALMGAYYGGSAFSSASAKSYAAAIISQGQQIAAAWMLYVQSGGNQHFASGANTFYNMTGGPLVTNGYLAQWPRIPREIAATNGSFIDGLDNWYACPYDGTACGGYSVNGPTANGMKFKIDDTTDLGREVCRQFVK